MSALPLPSPAAEASAAPPAPARLDFLDGLRALLPLHLPPFATMALTLITGVGASLLAAGLLYRWVEGPSLARMKAVS